MSELPPRSEAAAQAWEALSPILSTDAKSAEEDARRLGTAQARRAAVRTLFSCLEGAIYLQRLIPLATAQGHPEKYTPAEIALLKEETYILTHDGVPKTSRRFLRIEENLLFTARMVAKLEDVSPEIDLTSEGWNALKESIKVRHRVTHPRTTGDLEVTPEEFERAVIGYKWAVHLLAKALARSYLKLSDTYRALGFSLDDKPLLSQDKGKGS